MSTTCILHMQWYVGSPHAGNCVPSTGPRSPPPYPSGTYSPPSVLSSTPSRPRVGATDRRGGPPRIGGSAPVFEHEQMKAVLNLEATGRERRRRRRGNHRPPRSPSSSRGLASTSSSQSRASHSPLVLVINLAILFQISNYFALLSRTNGGELQKQSDSGLSSGEFGHCAYTVEI
jgi:hypothetical protein